MSKYTTQLRWIVEQVQSENGEEIGTAKYSENVYRKIGLDSYPIFDETHRFELNDKIINNYYFCEIGFETAAQFSFHLRSRMNLIMPYYNQMYESASSVTDPMTDFSNERTEHWGTDRKNQGTVDSDVTATGTSGNRNVFSDTPMSMLDDEPNAVENLRYATTVTFDDSDTHDASKTETATSNTATESGNRSVTETGRRFSQAELLEKWRSTFVNIDMDVVNELRELFMGLW